MAGRAFATLTAALALGLRVAIGAYQPMPGNPPPQHAPISRARAATKSRRSLFANAPAVVQP